MDNTILLYNNTLNLNLKQAMNDTNDVLYNMQNLKQFQWNIDQIQKMKNGAQMQVNMAALTLWRKFILEEGNDGIWLFRNLVRKYYPLNDDRILKYEICQSRVNRPLKTNDGKTSLCRPSHLRYITNWLLFKRKGEKFTLGGYKYSLSHLNYTNTSCVYEWGDCEICLEVSDLNDFSAYPFNDICKNNFYIDFVRYGQKISITSLVQNCLTKWSWELVCKIIDDCKSKDIELLLQNDGFFAQMGINNIRETLNHLQEIVGSSFEIAEDMKNKVIARLEQKGIALYSYLPITKDFIMQHQDELDWKVIQKSPRIQWDWELINLYLRKVKETVSENKREEYLLGSKAMYAAIENYLNDDILNDIEKLYNIA